ncbi:DNA gyrase subunit A [Harryflintia acetispora]|uniref:DNA gyrase subunit A n=2 Tax=Harryflintia acetispora TaxID=1849041 RepID=A0A9X8Y9D6_9FIRM|nr:DNA gyrase subunit A [Harryflintia acetispora]
MSNEINDNELSRDPMEEEGGDGGDGGTKVIPVEIRKEMKKSFIDYSMSVITSRALPDVRDGLKPVHRRILYTMYDEGITPEKAYRKSAYTVGAVLGSYHPHGDASVYDALVRLAQTFSMRYPLVDGQGNFGSMDGDPPAAQRYTEAKMSKVAVHMLTDIEKDTVDFVPNYDDSTTEPSVLPARFPNLLVNGSAGIAVGMATNIPPHNLGEVIDATIHLIDNPDAELAELMEFVQGPDFPTGGQIMGRSGIRAAYATGRGKIILRGKADIEEMKNGKQRIVITETPYMVTRNRIVTAIADLVKDKRVENITALRDESNLNGTKIVVELRRDANAQVILNQLYTFTPLQDTVGVIMLALVDGQPRILTLKAMLTEYLKHQKEVIIRRTRFDLRKAQDRAHILEGLKKAIDFIDEVIRIIRGAPDIPGAKAALIERFAFSDLQAAAIVAMRVGQLSGLERKKIEDELGNLQILIQELTEILGDEGKVYDIIRKELLEVKNKFNNPRRSEILAISGEMDIEDLIPVEDCVITLTHYGYIKRQVMDVYRTQRRGGRGVSGMTRREEDFVEELFICSTHDYIMFFTSKGRVFRLKGYEIAEGSRASRGTNIVNLLQLDEGEKVSAMIQVDDIEQDKYLTMVTKRGIIKRTALSAFKNVRKIGLIAISLDEDDELAWVRLTGGEDELVVATRKGMAIRFNESDARPLGRTARGVKALNLGDEDEVVGMEQVREDATLLTIAENGLGRRTPIEDYRLQSRGGKGITNYKAEKKETAVAGIKMVDEDDDLILITDDGVIIRVPVEQITVQSRYGGGVKTMRIGPDSKVVSLARAPHEEEDEGGEEETGEPQGEEPGGEPQSPQEGADGTGGEPPLPIRETPNVQE